MDRIIQWNQLDEAEKKRLLDRSEADISKALAGAQEIIEAVRLEGDQAIARFCVKFDYHGAKADNLWVSPGEFDHAIAELDQSVKTALDIAMANISKFHQEQVPHSSQPIEISPGLTAIERWVPLDKVALYVPHGKGSFPSMLYMLAIPAKLAAVKEIIVASPPNSDGSMDAACLYVARSCGINRVLKVGGAQAIAALALGTQTIPKVDKIVGPGSSWVSAAKRLLGHIVDTGLPAGPSESMVLLGKNARLDLVALDLMIEAEHGPDSQAFAVTWDLNTAKAIVDQIESLLPKIETGRRAFIETVFSRYGAVIVVDSEQGAIDLVNLYAPEHLQIQGDDASELATKIKHAGEILLGSWLPFSLANYACGPNAVLPTGGKARSWSAVSVRDFMHSISVISANESAFRHLGPHVAVLADYEGFFTHALAIRSRLEE